jgi:hypothetical protein
MRHIRYQEIADELRQRALDSPAGHRVTPLTESSCRVAFTIPSWAPFYVPVCRLALRRLDARAMGGGQA